MLLAGPFVMSLCELPPQEGVMAINSDGLLKRINGGSEVSSQLSTIRPKWNPQLQEQSTVSYQLLGHKKLQRAHKLGMKVIVPLLYLLSIISPFLLSRNPKLPEHAGSI